MSGIDNLIAWLPKDHHELANKLVTVEMSPYFICIHYCLVTLSMRHRTGSREYASEHPFPSWFVCVTSCFGGTLLMNFLLGRPIIQVYSNTSNVIMATLIWYFVYFSPLDMFYKFTQLKFVKAAMLVLKEVHRIRMISNGVGEASKQHKDNIIIVTLIGCVKGSGAKFLSRPLDHLIRGNMISDNEFLKPTFSTKHSVVISVLLFGLRAGYFDMKEEMLLAVMFVIAAIAQTSIFLFGIKDPYEKLEKLLCNVLLRMPDELARSEKSKKE